MTSLILAILPYFKILALLHINILGDYSAPYGPVRPYRAQDINNNFRSNNVYIIDNYIPSALSVCPYNTNKWLYQSIPMNIVLRFIVFFLFFSFYDWLRIREPEKKYRETWTIGLISWPCLVKKIETLTKSKLYQTTASCLIEWELTDLNMKWFVPDSIKFQIISGVHWQFWYYISRFIMTKWHSMMLNTYFQTSKLVSVVKSSQCRD